MSTIINLFAGPGVGKSTIAAGIYFELKCKGVACELTGEVAKDKVWEDNPDVLSDQPYIFGKQQHRQRRLVNKVKYIISDSPILLSIIYSKEQSETFNKYVLEQHSKYTNLNFYIERNIHETGYEQIGRVHSLEQSQDKDNEILSVLNTNNIDYTYIKGIDSKDIVNQIMQYI